jgi:hypothetical protein
MKMSSPFRAAIAALKKRLLRLDYVCTGNLRRRYAVCGSKNCCCKAPSPQRHGPYYYWSRLLDRKVVQRVLSSQDAAIVARGIANYRKAKALLRKWEAQTVQGLKNSRARKQGSTGGAPQSRLRKLQTAKDARTG